MIPKVIHYCWFGGSPLPTSAIKCIKSWQKFLPEYEVKEWNESNFDINIVSYTKEAYEAKKYAFVSDYARFWILFHYGGIYFDTDVQVLKPMDAIIAVGNFMGREAGAYMREMDFGYDDGLAVNPGIGFGMEAGNTIVKEILDNYSKVSFIKPDGTLNLKTIVNYTTEVLYKHGLSHENNEIVSVENIWIYPADVFCPMDHTRGNKVTITNNTVSIHLYDCSWLNHKSFGYRMHLLKNWLIRYTGEKFINQVTSKLRKRL